MCGLVVYLKYFVRVLRPTNAKYRPVGLQVNRYFVIALSDYHQGIVSYDNIFEPLAMAMADETIVKGHSEISFGCECDVI